MKQAKFLLAGLAVLCASAAMAGELQIPNSLAVAQVGEWAMYSMPNDYVQKQTVVARTGDGPEDTVTVRIENIYHDQVVNTTEIVKEAGEPYHPIELPDEPGASVKFWRRVFTINGQAVNALAIEIDHADSYDNDDDDDDEVIWYLSADVPVFGIVRQESDDDLAYDLVDFGWN